MFTYLRRRRQRGPTVQDYKFFEGLYDSIPNLSGPLGYTALGMPLAQERHVQPRFVSTGRSYTPVLLHGRREPWASPALSV